MFRFVKCIILKDGYWYIWGDLWTWPPWLICASAFNQKLKKFCIHRGFSEIIFLKKPHKRTEEIRIGPRKTTSWNIAVQELPDGRTNSKWLNDGWNSKRPTNSLIWPITVLSLVFLFRYFFCEIKTLSTYLIFLRKPHIATFSLLCTDSYKVAKSTAR